MKKTNTTPSTKLLGKYCDGVQAIIAVSEGLGYGKAKPDDVLVLAFSLRDVEGYKGGEALLSKTNIREMVKLEVDWATRTDTGTIDKEEQKRFRSLRSALIKAAEIIEKRLPPKGKK